MLDTTKPAPKIIIIEGPDNCGKDTLISRLKDYYKDVRVIHAGIPTSKNLFEFYYDGLIHDTLAGYYDNSISAVIHNRSIYGEYIYGPKYRHESKELVEGLIHKLEVGQLRTFIFSRDLYFILLTSSSSDLLVKNDDGLSYSSKKSDIEDELQTFNDIFDKSIIENKKKVFVNDGNNFRCKDDIYKDIISFIEHTRGDLM
jgi:thymidylate kinase